MLFYPLFFLSPNPRVLTFYHLNHVTVGVGVYVLRSHVWDLE